LKFYDQLKVVFSTLEIPPSSFRLTGFSSVGMKKIGIIDCLLTDSDVKYFDLKKEYCD